MVHVQNETGLLQDPPQHGDQGRQWWTVGLKRDFQPRDSRYLKNVGVVSATGRVEMKNDQRCQPLDSLGSMLGEQIAVHLRRTGSEHVFLDYDRPSRGPITKNVAKPTKLRGHGAEMIFQGL